MEKKERLAAIVGPTAVGKTAISVLVADIIGAEIISVDSMQVYQGMDIGTAKAREDEMITPSGEKIPHHLINIINPNENFSVADFQRLARTTISKINNQGKIPLLVGGTGLYFNSIIEMYNFTEMNINWEFRRYLKEKANKYGSEYLYHKLAQIDSDTAQKLHPKDQKRIIRALEVYQQTGQKLSELRVSDNQVSAPYHMAIAGLIMEREALYQRINDRVDQMIRDGLIKEVLTLLNKGYHLNLSPMQGLGYRQIGAYLMGFLSKEEAINLLKRDTRRYAKRQLTWFRRDKRITWFNVTNKEIFLLANEIAEYIRRTLGIFVE
ncbi:MAG: tRNA (adenosine(37)-N6)-dimethylallyltransferase MiaA [Bacillota bacterium]|jgi:tRNA dimethylallyltransferase